MITVKATGGRGRGSVDPKMILVYLKDFMEMYKMQKTHEKDSYGFLFLVSP